MRPAYMHVTQQYPACSMWPLHFVPQEGSKSYSYTSFGLQSQQHLSCQSGVRAQHTGVQKYCEFDLFHDVHPTFNVSSDALFRQPKHGLPLLVHTVPVVGNRFSARKRGRINHEVVLAELGALNLHAAPVEFCQGFALWCAHLLKVVVQPASDVQRLLQVTF